MHLRTATRLAFFFEYRSNRIYPQEGTTHLDSDSGMCYRRFFIPKKRGENKASGGVEYLSEYLPSECDPRALTVGQPELRLPKFIPPGPKLKRPIHHHEIERDIVDGGLAEFPKNIHRQFIYLGKKVAREINYRRNKAHLYIR